LNSQGIEQRKCN